MTAREFEERLGDLCAHGVRAPFPRRQRDRHILLRSLVQTLDAANSYSEKSINEAVRAWMINVASGLDVDHVALRRYLVDDGYLRRDAEGAVYRVDPGGNGGVLFDEAVRTVDPIAVVASTRERAAARKAARSSVPPHGPDRPRPAR